MIKFMKNNVLYEILILIAVICNCFMFGCSGEVHESDISNNVLLKNMEVSDLTTETVYFPRSASTDYCMNTKNDKGEENKYSLKEDQYKELETIKKGREHYGKQLYVNIMYDLQNEKIVDISICGDKG